MLSKLTPSSGVLLGLSAFTVAVAVYYNNPLLVYTAVFLVVTNVVLFAWAHATVKGLSIERLVAPASLAGLPTEIVVELANSRHTPRYGMLAFDLHSGATPGKDYSQVAFQAVQPGAKARSSYRIVPLKRGVYEIGPLFIYGGDPFGLYKCWQKIDKKTQLVVLPCPVRFSSMHPASRSELARDESGTIARSGNSMEFLGIREYTQGEPLKRIHWPTSARLGKLYSRQFEMNVASSLSVLIVGDENMAAGTSVDCAYEYAITMTASIAAASNVERYHVHWLALHGSGHDHLSGSGPRFQAGTSLKLARLPSPGRLNWDEALRLALGLLPKTSALIVFCAGEPEAWADRLDRLALHFKGLVAVVYDTASMERASPMPTARLSTKTAAAYPVLRAGYRTSQERLLRNLLGLASIERLSGSKQGRRIPA